MTFIVHTLIVRVEIVYSDLVLESSINEATSELMIDGNDSTVQSL